ncbi:MAG TPA: hypothetical protein VNK23_02245 [Candidatus Dormibacteraeota bacterium]|nr:hypothetical protein [Candidatus Dormibacteraeota bacterium]
MRLRKRWSSRFACVLILTGMAIFCARNARAANQPDVPNVNADIGTCSADFTVKDGTGKPVYNAKINITIKYGFMNLHKAQLEAPTNTNGEARFTGLPNFSKKPLKFVISSGTVSKTVEDDPTTNCSAKFNVTLSVH